MEYLKGTSTQTAEQVHLNFVLVLGNHVEDGFQILEDIFEIHIYVSTNELQSVLFFLIENHWSIILGN